MVRSFENTSPLPLRWFFALFYKVLYYAYWSQIYYQYRQKYEISPKFRFNGTRIMINGNGRFIALGAGQLGHNTYIEVADGDTLVLGNNVHCSKNVVIYTAGYDHNKLRKSGKLCKKPSTVTIGDNVFIKPFVWIRGSCTIPSGTIIEPFTVIK